MEGQRGKPFLFDEPSAGQKGDRLMTCAHGLEGPCYGKKVSSRRSASGVRYTMAKNAGTVPEFFQSAGSESRE